MVTLERARRNTESLREGVEFVVRRIAHHVAPTSTTPVPRAIIDKNRHSKVSPARQCVWQPPPQHPPPDGIGAAAGAEPPEFTDAKTLSTRTALGCPSGHTAGLLASDIGRRSSNVVSQVRHRNSYNGMNEVYATRSGHS